MISKFIVTFGALLASATVVAQTTSDSATARYFEKIKSNPQQLLVFLQAMPKGGDLHNHHGGASMAENMLRYALNDHLCVDQHSNSIAAIATCPKENLLENIQQDSTLYNRLIDAWSMRFFTPGQESGHDHFFATFFKFYPIVDAHSGEIMAEIVERAAQQNELYLELLMTSENFTASELGKKIGWNADLAVLREKLLASGIDKIVKTIATNFSNDEAKLNKAFACGTPAASSACDVKVRYQYLALREQPPEQVFAQLLVGFELANQDARVLGVNMVQAEDGFISMRDYKLHMKMVGFLHSLYPKVHVSLHAGELSSSLVPLEALRFHIRDAINIGNAERIGHGVDVAYEENADQLLKDMAKKAVLVEINLTSNDSILGVKGSDHPLPLYLKYNVPVALSTDDEGVLRTSLTEQYQKAILTYQFSYPTVKKLVRNSIAYSFLPGKSLWQNSEYQQVNAGCAKDILGTSAVSATCKQFLDTNEKAKLQWELESRFKKFESFY